MNALRPVALAVLASVAACDPVPAPEPSPDPTMLYSYGLLWMSGGNWDLPAEVGATLRAYSYGQHPTTLTLKSAALYRATDLTTPVATLALRLETPQLDFAGTDNQYVNLVNDGTLNRDLAGACGQVELVLVFHSSSCDCDVSVQGSEGVLCYADNGADPELATVGEPALAGRPCGLRSYTTSDGVETLDSEETFRYDTAGRLLFSDERDSGGTWQTRTFYTYASGALLGEREIISPTARAVSSRTTYGYTGGVLSTISRDGEGYDLPDGTADATTTYGFSGNTWTESDGAATTTYTYDPGALTLTSADAVFHLGAAIDEPSRFFATTRVDMPRIDWSEHVSGLGTMTVSYTYSGDALLGVQSSVFNGWSFRDEFLYTCP